MTAPRHGVIVQRHPSGGGLAGKTTTYVVRDEEDGRHFSFDYRDIVTEGFRTVRDGERVRFHPADDDPDRAAFVVRLSQPAPEAYYS